MGKLLVDKKYSVSHIAKELNLSTVLANGIQRYFRDPVSIKELSQITKSEFLHYRLMGRKRWSELQSALANFDLSVNGVRFVEINGGNRITVEIDVSKPFKQVVQELSEIIENFT